MYSLNGGGLSSKNNFIDLISANYTLRIVDKFGCIKDTSIFLSEPSTLNTFVELTTLDDCFPIGTGTLKVNSSGVLVIKHTQLIMDSTSNQIVFLVI